MRPTLTIEVFRAAEWHVAARIERQRGSSRTDPTWLEYETDYVPDHLHARDHRAVSCRFPVDYSLTTLPTFPAFACDLMPQGEARRALEGKLRNDGETPSDWSVLQHGAQSPVGNLRVVESVVESVPSPGFTREDVIERGDAFREWAELEQIPMTGASDTSGASPKLLLTQDEDGRLHADGALPDARARGHFLVKFPRGRTRRDELVLASEPGYLELARRFGARCGDPLTYDRGALFVPRFDRVRGSSGVERAGLESLYSIAGVVEPGARLEWEASCASIAEVVDDPEECVLELVRRDVLGLAFGDTDNHGRNTSVIKLSDGRVTLSPLYDFAPMVLDPELVKRSTLWRSERPGEPPDWADVATSLEGMLDRARLVAELHRLGAELDDAPAEMRRLGIDDEVVRRCEPFVRAVVAGLQRAS